MAAAWAIVGVHAWRRAARRRAVLGAPSGGGAADLIALAPPAILLVAALWTGGGGGAEPALVVDAYLDDWRAGRLEAAAARFADPPSAEALRSAWGRQDAALRNAVVRILAEEPEAVADAERPLDGLRWTDLGPTPAGGRSFAVEVARQETVRGELFVILPTTSLRLVAVERLGEVHLRPVPAGPAVLTGAAHTWRLVDVVIAGEALDPDP